MLGSHGPRRTLKNITLAMPSMVKFTCGPGGDSRECVHASLAGREVGRLSFEVEPAPSQHVA